MISIIAAIGKNNELGKDNKLIWHIKEDMVNFKELTMGKYIVMGANTYFSLPKKLEGRKYIVLSKKIEMVEDGLLYSDFDSLLEFVLSLDEEVMIIGGASIYKLFMPYADRLYLTLIEDTKEADAYFPEFGNEFKLVRSKDSQNDKLKYKFVTYERRK